LEISTNKTFPREKVYMLTVRLKGAQSLEVQRGDLWVFGLIILRGVFGAVKKNCVFFAFLLASFSNLAKFTLSPRPCASMAKTKS
jgi:hypothetical protein